MLCQFQLTADGFVHCPNCPQPNPNKKYGDDSTKWPIRNCLTKEEKQRRVEAAEQGAKKLGIVTKAAHYLQALTAWTFAGWPTRSDEEVAAVVVICRACKYFNQAYEACSLCGCTVNEDSMAVKNKAKMKTEICPKGKW
jgi:hypothetical protein